MAGPSEFTRVVSAMPTPPAPPPPQLPAAPLPPIKRGPGIGILIGFGAVVVFAIIFIIVLALIG
jgi:hypothetical protein